MSCFLGKAQAGKWFLLIESSAVVTVEIVTSSRGTAHNVFQGLMKYFLSKHSIESDSPLGTLQS